MNIMKKFFLVMIIVLFGLANQVQAMEFDDLGGIEVHGFISQGYLLSDENNFFADTEKGTTQFNEMGINFSSDVTEKLRLGVQFFARDMGTIGNNDVVLDWAIADYRWRDWLGVRAGNMKWVNGLYNESRDVDMLRTPIFLPQGVYNEAWRETSALIQGAGMYGELPANKVGSFSYDMQYGSMSMPVTGGPAKLLKDQVPGGLKKYYHITDVELESVNVDETFADAVKWNTPLEGLVIGGTYWGYDFKAAANTYIDLNALKSDAVAYQQLVPLRGVPAALLTPTQQAYQAALTQLDAAGLGAFYTDVNNNTASTVGLGGTVTQTYPTLFRVKARTLTGSMEYTWSNLVLAAEYMQTTYNVDIQNTIWKDYYRTPDGMLNVPEFDAVGYYGSLSYRFTYWFELGLYYSEYYRNKDDKDGETRYINYGGLEPKHRAWSKDYCMTTRFDINENWVLKLEGHVMNGTAVIYGADNPDPIGGVAGSQYEEDWYLGAAKVTYSF
ncbi:MAG: hypothetical protein C0403_07275 [Desulfobacterium sp.]|nr:hypothetical protein [Desulfobacterium sp.]